LLIRILIRFQRLNQKSKCGLSEKNESVSYAGIIDWKQKDKIIFVDPQYHESSTLLPAVDDNRNKTFYVRY
jgi:hypothetical protein